MAIRSGKPRVSGPVAARTARSLAPFVRIEEIEPGDVILTLGNDPISLAVAAAAGGKFSHAAIWVPHYDPELYHLMLVEADELGVGWSPLRSMVLDLDERKSMLVASLGDPPPLRCKVLRHPDIARVAPETMVEASKKLSEEYLNRSYSDHARLGQIADLTFGGRAYAATIGRALDIVRKHRDPTLRPGVFCSELVMLYLELIGLSPFTASVNPSSANPNHFVASASLLKDVSSKVLLRRGAISAAARIPEDDGLPWLSRKTFLPVVVKRTAQADAISKLVDTMNNRLGTQAKDMQAQRRQLFQQHKMGLVGRLQKARSDGDLWDADVLDRLLATALTLEYLEQTVAEHDETLELGAEADTVNSKIRRHCLNWLREMHILLVNDFNHDYLRHEVLKVLRTVRKLKRENPASKQNQFERERVKSISEWLPMKRRHASARKEVTDRGKNSPEQDAALATDLGATYVQEILQAARHAAVRDPRVTGAPPPTAH